VRIHELKVAGVFFPALLEGKKRFEVRKNDRGFQIGDFLLLRELTELLVFTGSWVLHEVEFILDDVRYGLQDQHIVMSLSEPLVSGQEATGFEAYRKYILPQQ
jgi:hypothetical protein